MPPQPIPTTTSSSDGNERALVRLVQLGDIAAYERLVQNLYRTMRSYAAGLVGLGHADDVLQETALQIYKEIRHLREPQVYRAWVYRVLTRIAFRHLRKDKQWRHMERDNAILQSIAEPERPSAQELDEAFTALLDRVSPASRAVLLLHYKHDIALGEVAAILDIPLGTAKSRLAYGLSTLRLTLKESNRHEH